jgi:hypothetical protein
MLVTMSARTLGAILSQLHQPVVVLGAGELASLAFTQTPDRQPMFELTFCSGLSIRIRPECTVALVL